MVCVLEVFLFSECYLDDLIRISIQKQIFVYFNVLVKYFRCTTNRFYSALFLCVVDVWTEKAKYCSVGVGSGLSHRLLGGPDCYPIPCSHVAN